MDVDPGTEQTVGRSSRGHLLCREAARLPSEKCRTAASYRTANLPPLKGISEMSDQCSEHVGTVAVRAACGYPIRSALSRLGLAAEPAAKQQYLRHEGGKPKTGPGH